MKAYEILIYNLYVIFAKKNEIEIDEIDKNALDKVYDLINLTIFLYALDVFGFFVYFESLASPHKVYQKDEIMPYFALFYFSVIIIHYFVLYRKKKYIEIVQQKSYGTKRGKIFSLLFIICGFSLWMVPVFIMGVNNSGGVKNFILSPNLILFFF